MATTNITNWGVSYIDANGVYHGGVNGVSGGAVNTYNEGAISPTDSLALLDGAFASYTLADGVAGQTITIKGIAVTAVTITPANFYDGTSITMDVNNEVAVLAFDGTNWQVVYTNATVNA